MASRKSQRQKKFERDKREIDKCIDEGRPEDIRIAKIKNPELLGLALKANQSVATKLKPMLKALRERHRTISDGLSQIEQKYYSTESKARVIEEKLEAIKSIPNIQKRTWYRYGTSSDNYFYPTGVTSSGRIKGYEVLKCTRTKLPIGPTYIVQQVTYSGTYLEKLGKLTALINAGDLHHVVPLFDKIGSYAALYWDEKKAAFTIL